MPWGYVGGVQCDPIEKKPFFHAYPGALALQLRDARLRPALRRTVRTGSRRRRCAIPTAVAPPLPSDARRRWSQDALRLGARVAGEHVQRAADHQRVGGRRSSRTARPRASRPGSSPTATARRRCSSTCAPGSTCTRSISRASTTGTTASSAGASSPILDTIRRLHAMGFWVEIVTLLIPGFNDGDDELTRPHGVSRRRVAGHPLARHGVPRRLQDDRARQHDGRDARCGPPTSAARSGLRYVYAGNLPGAVGDLEDTHCASCGRPARRASRIFVRALPRHRPTAAAPLRGRRARAMGSRFGGQLASRPFVPGSRSRF